MPFRIATFLAASAVAAGLAEWLFGWPSVGWGAWIGALERITIFGTLVAGWPEGLALVLALKGLGRYPELRAAETGGAPSGTAERFIIGTFTSVLWACSCAGVVALLLR